ncbi:cilia- and flagella-associated protein 161 isoform X3 [Sturnira hondurensis]|uniref:cilia- and flagella-associated protein 161 isoform X3 n=1 Tax=Sturnira hondurensis TaxID=192404 RepID=UPI00187A4CA3|nr:cilia- and flagella-associated protein 161 isoform X3 [Sturnira hondurensis]
MAQNLYGHGVRMGNWNEDVYLEEVQLSISKDGHIHHGDSVMLVNPDYPETEADLSLRGDLSLCLAPDEIRAHLSDTPEVPCGLSVAPTNIPVGRNTFVILSAEPAATGDVLRFGQNFRLGIVRGFDDTMLYLSSDHRTLLKSSKRSWLQEVYLTDEVSYLNCWQAAFPDPQLRLEHEGFPIPANSKILINHCHTNRGLAAHRHLFLRTYFGKEAEVAAHTHLDSHRAEKPRNHWMLVTGSPRKDSGTVLDEGTPPAQNTCALEQAAGPGAQ